ncbi:MAG: TonB-dependent receptor [Casimicrobiaceae bacterium]
MYCNHKSGDARRVGVVACAVFLLAAWQPASAATLVSMGPSDLAELSIEQLSSLVVTSVSRREERLADAASSIFVITGDEIRRSRATSLAEALRLAPNLDVARVDVNQYAVSARGFNNGLANKMLVLIDGRTVYTPLFSGVFWDAQDVMLEDVERIEVISGPGATLWGANAVNGVINVITRPARETQGVLATALLGDRQSGAALRYGGALANTGRYRVYGQYKDRDASRLASGGPLDDASIHGQAGFRADWNPVGQSLTVQGDAYFGNLSQLSGPRSVAGANLLGRYTRDLGEGRALRVQAYVDSTRRDVPRSFHEDLQIADLEVQYAMQAMGRHNVLLGGGYRHAWDDVDNSAAQAFLPAQRTLHWAHVFAQDDIALAERVDLTVGAKVESSVYTGAEFLPNLRLAWRYAPDRLLWAALSRAVRAPSRLDRDLFIPGTPPYTVLQANPQLQAEVSNVAEIGYRSQPSSNVSYSLTTFYHHHDRLRSYELTPGYPHFANLAEGRTYGVEGWTSWRITPAWRVTAGGVALRQQLRLQPGSRDPGTGLASLGNDPSGWWSIRSAFDLTPRHEIDVSLRHVGPRGNPAVPAYTSIDARLGWKVSPRTELSLVVQNALDPGHPEWGSAATAAEVQRAVFVKILVRL